MRHARRPTNAAGAARLVRIATPQSARARAPGSAPRSRLRPRCAPIDLLKWGVSDRAFDALDQCPWCFARVIASLADCEHEHHQDPSVRRSDGSLRLRCVIGAATHAGRAADVDSGRAGRARHGHRRRSVDHRLRAGAGAGAREGRAAQRQRARSSEIISETKRLRDRSRPCIQVAGQLRTGRVKITIGSDGRALRVELNGYLQGTPEGGCVTAAFRDFHVAPFAGEPVTVKVSISLP